MGNIRIERVPIQAMDLGKLRADHLMLVFQQDPLDYGYYQDRWWVMEGTRDTNPDGTVTLGVDGADGVTTLSEANGGKTAQELLDAIRYPSWRGSHIIPSLDPFGDWQLMATVARDIDSALYPYFAFNFALNPLPTVNSSSVIASLLYFIGIDIAENMPDTFLTFTIGTGTLLGTSGDDQLQMEWSFNTILSGAGSDTIAGADDVGRYEKLYGGSGDDVLVWSEGSHVYHGGQSGLDYADDGIDSVEYTGIGTVRIDAVEGAVQHRVADYLAIHASGTDQLFSIEKIRWNPTSDTIVLGEGVQFGDTRLLFELDGETPGSQGDTLDFSNQSSGLLVAPSNQTDIVLIGTAIDNGQTFSDRGGIWAQSLEWLVGSRGDDHIHAGSGLLGLEGGAGNDILSGRLAEPLLGNSPQGYDIELSGGEGNDTLISGSGRSLATGGDGNDVFVLSALSSPGRVVEFVITDADTSDRLFVPYNFLKPDSAGYESSELFPILGGVSPGFGGSSFEDLPQHIGTGPQGVLDQGGYFYLIWQTQMDQIFVPDASDGIIDFAGHVFFNRDGNDLLIHVFAGFAYEQVYFDYLGQPFLFTDVALVADSEAVIRVVDFQEGMLGIEFYDLGERTPFDFVNFAGPGSTTLYENWDAIAAILTNNGALTAPLPAEPETPIFDLPANGQQDEREQLEGTDGDDFIIAGLTSPAARAAAASADTPYSSGADISGGAGNDTLIGSEGRDRIDGGSGADEMSGGAGNDSYLVDNVGDLVIESANAGIDSVAASIDYTLPENVENLSLVDAAIEGRGNGTANRITGSASDNILTGGGGSDTLYGGLGNDWLDGGSASDVFVYMIGDGIDTITDEGSTDDVDILKLNGLSPFEVGLFVSAADADDAVLRFADGGRIVLNSFFAGHSIDLVSFDDGTSWNRDFLVNEATAAGALLNDAPVARADDGFFTHLTDVVIPRSDLLANDFDTDGDELQIIAAATETTGASATVTAEGDVRIAVAPGQAGAVLFTYTISDGRGGTSTGHADITFLANAAPVLTGAAPANQAIEAGAAWSFSLPADLFTDPDGHSMIYTAGLADGGVLPSWLSYDPDTRTFDGIPPATFTGELQILITASDSVASTSTTFSLTVTGIHDGGPNTITGTGGRDVLIGTSSNDVIDGLGDNDRLDGGDGDDIFLASGNAGFDTYLGGDGFDTIRGSSGDDIIGIAGRTDLLTGIEAIDGGDGFDIVRLTDAANSLDLSLITLTSIELIDAGGGTDMVIGSAGDDVIMGGRGADVLFGGAGNDTFLFTGRSGRDDYDGGDGFDTIIGSSNDDVLRLENGSANLVSIEALVFSDGFDKIRLGPGDDMLDLSGLAVSGLEQIEGGAGNDRIVASSADETIVGGAGQDIFVFQDNFDHDTIADFRLSRGGTRPSDKIDLSNLGFATFGNILANAGQIGFDTVIGDPDSGSTLTLSKIRLSDLHADDFIL